MSIDDDRTQTYVALSSGTLVGRYRIVQELGVGGMGEVYQAEDTELKRQVALKFLPYRFISDETAKVRFKREAEATAQLSHPNIVTIHEVSEYKGRPFFAMEHCQGRSLRELIVKERLSLNRILDVAIQIGEGLAEAHRAGVIHRDIKPSNVIVGVDGRVKVVDFGLAALRGKDKLTKTGTTMGTVGYMSPEQVRGEEVDHRSDLFSLGVVLYEMIAGKAPFEKENEAATLYAIVQETPQPLDRFRSALPDNLQKTVSRLLEKTPERRFPSAVDVVAELKRLQFEFAKRPSTQTRKSRRNRYVVVSAALIVLLIAGYWLYESLPSLRQLLKRHEDSSEQATSFEPGSRTGAWPEANKLFRQDPYWVGADDAWSVDLGKGRTLWLFLGTRIDPTGHHSRAGSKYIHNSVAIQTGYDPSQASITFHWKRDEAGNPASFFPEEGNEWFWPEHGIRLEDHLLLFFLKVSSSEKFLGFEVNGWQAVMINNPDQDPSEWQLTWLESPANEFGAMVGSGGVLQLGEYVYAFSHRDIEIPLVLLARWQVENLLKGDLSGIQWWAGEDKGWVRQADLEAPPDPLMHDPQVDMSVYYNISTWQFVCIQTLGFGQAVIGLRTAGQPTGPWREPDTVYIPPEFNQPKIDISGAKGHPQLVGADLVLTYFAKSSGFFEPYSDSLMGYPRFVRLFRVKPTPDSKNRISSAFSRPRNLAGSDLQASDSLPSFQESLKADKDSSGSTSFDRSGSHVIAWPEADQLFRQDPYWVGADGASSVDLGNGKFLWLFGDTRIDQTGRHSRKNSRFIRNSIAIQTGYDPTKASITFYWRKNKAGEPSSFFPERGDEWYWPGHGIRLENQLLLFLMRVRGTKTGLGFEHSDYDAVMVSNPDENPIDWNIRWLDTPANDLGIAIGSSSVLKMDEYVYAFGSREPIVPHPMYVVRWPIQEVLNGDLSGIQWWTGSYTGWKRQAQIDEEPEPAFREGQSDLSVHFDNTNKEFVCIQTVGFGPAILAIRKARELTGPWTEPEEIYRPPEMSREKIMIYSGKAHPQLVGANLVLTYCTNTFDLFEQAQDTTIYYPHFVRLFRTK
jgi:serine/threonine protein kinase